MFKALRWKLTMLTALLTGLVVVGIGAVLLGYTSKLYKEAQRSQLETTAVSLNTLWSKSDTLRYDDLADLQKASDITVLYFAENGIDLFDAWQHDETLIQDAFEALSAAGFDLSTPMLWEPADLQAEAVFSSAGQPYRCVLLRERAGQNVRSVLVVRSRTAELRYLKKMMLYFAVVVIIALGGVGLVGWAVSGRAIQPIQTYLKRQDEFVAAASHELKTPLAVLETGFDTMEARPDKQAVYLGMMRAETQRMQSLVAELLDIAREQNGTLQIMRQPVELTGFLAEYEKEAELICQHTGTVFCLRSPENGSSVTIQADPERLAQILTILLDNAARYSPAGAQVELALESRRGKAGILVIDHGPGIAPAERERVFEKFYRGDASRTEKGHFGLGLSLAKQLVTAQDGKIKIQDTPGGGATFVVSFPLTQ